MRKLLTVALALALVLCIARALQAQELQWERTFGGAEQDDGIGVLQTDDGGYIILAYTESNGAGSGDVWLIKTDSAGVTEWDQTFGGTDRDFGSDVQQTDDGGYILVGGTDSYGLDNTDVWLIKTSSSGVMQWTHVFGGPAAEYGSTVQQTNDGGYIIGAKIHPDGGQPGDVWLVKTDSSGDREWDQIFGGTGDDWNPHVQQTSDGGYVIAANTASFGAGDVDVWLIKTDSAGVMQWDRTFGGPLADWSFDVRQTDDGGYVIVGRTRSYGAGGEDVWLIKTDSAGITQWDRTFGGPNYDNGYGVQLTSDGGYIITGKYGAEGGDVWLIKTDSGGIMEWDLTFGGTGYDVGNAVQETEDGGYIIAGHKTPPGAPWGICNVWLIKVTNPDSVRYYADSDGDDYGDPSDYRWLLGPSDPYTSLVAGDCNDDDPAINPASPEICDDGIDNDCDTMVDADDLYCQGLSAISCHYPPNQSVLYASPSFTWTPYGGTNNRFAVDLSTDWTFSWYVSTFETLHQPITMRNWTMPQGIWSFIPSNSYIYWRVRGVDLNADRSNIVTSDEVWWFYKF